MAGSSVPIGIDVQSPTILVGGQIVLPDTMSASQRGIVGSLGRLVGLNLNAVAATQIFLTPAAGIVRCVVNYLVLDNFSGTPTTNAVSFGASATPTDYLPAAVIAAVTTAQAVRVFPATNVAFAIYLTAISFVANVTVGGAAITCDIRAIGYYE